MKNIRLEYYLWALLLPIIFSACCKPAPINNCEDFLIQKFLADKQDYWMPPGAGAISKNSNGFFSFQYFSTANNVYQSSIEVVGDCKYGSLYLGWMDINANLNPKWYHYKYTNCDGEITFRFEPEANIASPPYPYYMSMQRNNFKARPRPTGAWCEYDDYDAWYIPHWSPIIDGKHQLIEDIHEYYSEGSAADVMSFLNNAKPYNGEDLEDRTLTGWETVPMRGVVKKAAHPYGDLDIDHLKGCKATYGGIPAEIHFPEKGADWDMYIKPDPDMNYLGTDAKPYEVGCEIEDWTLRDDNHYYRPLYGDYLQTAGKWAIDCGHAINNNFDNGFFTEIHPPEYLVASRYTNGVTTARIIGTGAFKNWSGSFLVWPGPRPSPYHTLAWELIDEDRQNMDLTIEAVPAANPNHLVCTIHRTGGDDLRIDDEGVVYQRCDVIYKARIRCYWKSNRIKRIEAIKIGNHFKGIDWAMLDDTKIIELISASGFVSVPGIITQMPGDYFAKVRYKLANPDSLTNNWEEVPVTNSLFNLNLKAGQTYNIVAVSPQGKFTPDRTTITVTERTINGKDTVRLNFLPNRFDTKQIQRYSLQELVKKYSGTDNVIATLSPLMGRIFKEPNAGGIEGMVVMNLPTDAAGNPIPGSALTIKTGFYKDSTRLLQSSPTIQVVGKQQDQQSFTYFDGKLTPIQEGASVRISFYSGTDKSGYTLQYQSPAIVNKEGQLFFDFKPAHHFFAGRIVVQLEENKAYQGTNYSIVSEWVETGPPLDSIVRNQDLVNFNALRKDSEKFSEFGKEAKEFSDYIRSLSNANPHLFRIKVRKTKEVKARR